MIRLKFTSYGGTHTLKQELRLVPVDPTTGPSSIILTDEQGYYGFISDKKQLTQLRDWLDNVLHVVEVVSVRKRKAIDKVIDDQLAEEEDR